MNHSTSNPIPIENKENPSLKGEIQTHNKNQKHQASEHLQIPNQHQITELTHQTNELLHQIKGTLHDEKLELPNFSKKAVAKNR